MTQPVVDREVLKIVVRELLKEEPGLFLEILNEFRNDKRAAKSKYLEVRKDRIKSMIQEDFDELDEVFRALA